MRYYEILYIINQILRKIDSAMEDINDRLKDKIKYY